MSSANIDGLNVAAAYVTELSPAVAFYNELLGFEKVRDMDPGILLHSQGANLTL